MTWDVTPLHMVLLLAVKVNLRDNSVAVDYTLDADEAVAEDMAEELTGLLIYQSIINY